MAPYSSIYFIHISLCVRTNGEALGLCYEIGESREHQQQWPELWTDKYYTRYRLEGNVIGFPSFNFSAFAFITFAIISSGIYNHINQVHVAEYNRLFQIVKVLYCCQAYIIIMWLLVLKSLGSYNATDRAYSPVTLFGSSSFFFSTQQSWTI